MFSVILKIFGKYGIRLESLILKWLDTGKKSAL